MKGFIDPFIISELSNALDPSELIEHPKRRDQYWDFQQCGRNMTVDRSGFVERIRKREEFSRWRVVPVVKTLTS